MAREHPSKLCKSVSRPCVFMVMSEIDIGDQRQLLLPWLDPGTRPRNLVQLGEKLVATADWENGVICSMSMTSWQDCIIRRSHHMRTCNSLSLVHHGDGINLFQCSENLAPATKAEHSVCTVPPVCKGKVAVDQGHRVHST